MDQWGLSLLLSSKKELLFSNYLFLDITFPYRDELARSRETIALWFCKLTQPDLIRLVRQKNEPFLSRRIQSFCLALLLFESTFLPPQIFYNGNNMCLPQTNLRDDLHSFLQDYGLYNKVSLLSLDPTCMLHKLVKFQSIKDLF